MTQRLTWRDNPTGGFIAYPEGEQHDDRLATLTQNGADGAAWRWRVRYGSAALAGEAHEWQDAADAATTAWSRVVVLAAQMKAEETGKLELIAMVAQAAVDGDARRFHVDTAPYQRLIDANSYLRELLEWKLRKRDDTGAIEAVLATIAAELTSRRERREVP